MVTAWRTTTTLALVVAACSDAPGADAGVVPPDSGAGARDADRLDAPDPCPGSSECGGVCVDTVIDPAHCGRCDNSCASGLVCSFGGCEPSCTAGRVNCSGSCVDLQSTRLHCSMCGNACRPDQRCSRGTCDCGGSECDGVCVDLDTDPMNCGSCGSECDPGQTCDEESCVG